MSALARWIALARPKGAALIASLPLVGFGFGLWERGSDIHPKHVIDEVLGLWLAWTCGHAGAMWLNAELDRDEGAVLFGRPVSVPRGTAALGYVALVFFVAVAWLVDPLTGVCAGANALLAVLYSHPRTAWKGHPFGGPFVNGVGYGMLSPLGGWAAAGTPFTWRAAVVLGFGGALVLGVYFAAQAFQREEDAARGYRTLVVTHGPARTLQIARGCLAACMLGASALAVVGVFPRLGLVLTPIWFFADRHMGRWSRAQDGGTGRDAATLVGWIALGVVLGIVAIYADHLSAMFAGRPLGGCGTAIVPAALAEVCR